MVGIIHILITVVIFHKEAKHVFIGNGILYQVFVKTVAEDFLCGMSVHRILYKDRRARKSEHLRVVEELHDVLVAISEMASMTLIEYHHDARMTYFFYTTAIPQLADSCIKFLNGGNDNLRIAVQTLHQFVCVVGTVNGTRLKSLVFGLGLRVKVMTVYHEHNLVHVVQLRHKLGCLERSQGFACSCCMPDIAVIIRVFHTVKNLLHGIELVRAKYHQAFVSLVQYNVLANNLAQRTLVEEHCGKLLQVVERHIGGIRPVKRELIATVRIVGEIAGVHAVRYYEQLNVIEQPVKGGLVIALYLIICLFQFHTSALKFYLN